jgi:outer membrane protein insertion porin family
MKKFQKLFLLSSMLFFAGAVSAQDFKVDRIQVNGNKRVETATVEAFLNVAPGQTVSKSHLDDAFRRMYDTGLFEDLNMSMKSGTLIVNVKENSTVSEVTIDGNDKIDEEKILPELKVQPRSIFKEADVQADVKRILTLYQRSGRYGVEVDPKIEKLDDGRVNITYKIDEGDRAEVAQISFIGNKAFDEGDLESIVSTKESAWYRFFSGNDVYDPDRLEYDRELLRRHYVANGYADIRIVSADAEFNEADKSFNIVYTVDEGQHYNFGKIGVESSIPDITMDNVSEQIRTEEGDEFNANRVEETVNNLTDHLGDKGYAFVRIDPQYQKDESGEAMAINYVISEGPRVYVNRINIIGNTRTMDEVIRREFRIAEGDPYNSSKLKRSKQRVEALGFFSKVDLENQQTEQADKVDVNVKVEEQSTGELTFGAGFSSSDGALGDVSVTERNLLGKGQFLRANFTLASSRKEADVSFTEPYFLDKNFAAGFDIFNVVTSRDDTYNNYTFDNETRGITLRGTYPLTEYFDHTVRYTLRNDDVSNPDPLASVYVLEQVGERMTSLVGQTFTYNTLDNQFMPTSGWLASLSQDVAGLGGDVQYLKHEAKVNYFTPLAHDMEDWVVKLTGRAGHVFGLGDDDVAINDRFFIGSSVIRGFDNQGIGPRDATTTDPLGGNTYYAASTEMMFPLGLPEELGIKGAVFADAASLSGVDTALATTTIQDDSSIRSSVGVGMFWRSPVGPVRIDLATPVTQESYDETETIRFSFGTKF